ncbi:DUF58 domain-containing protein [Microbacterium sediminis]|uniref:DUF58 domain-containing protein n=1 Tax=Microbacterium sediminis TaxID=904291 RepID=UPI000A07B5F1|nr:DUF58 domain-containing protein [Microbacterium sediminis]QBR73485.1 DUF58 domain-containing protein [Microbacterium sediminis]
MARRDAAAAHGRGPLTLRGWGVLAVGIACVPVAANIGVVEPYYVGLALLGLLVAGWLIAQIARPVRSVSRRLSEDSVEVGAEATVDVWIDAAPPRRPPAGRWRDRLPRGLSGDAAGVLRRVRGSQVRLSYAVTGIRRGRHPLGPLELTASDPFGLWRRTVAVGDTTTVLVVPRAQWLAPLPASFGETGDGLSPDERSGQGADNLIPRPYAPGDSMRRIHWRASAHRGTFMVRDEEQESTPAATVLLDLTPLHWPPEARDGDDPGFERAVTACVSAAWRLACDGYAVTVVDHSGRELAELTSAEGTALEALERAFATVAPDRGDLARDAAPFAAPASPGPLVVVCGTLDDRLAEALDPLARRSSLPVLLTPAPLREALDRAREAGWAASPLGDDVAESWETALHHATAGAEHGDR